MELITLETSEEGIALVTINRPKALNALNAQVLSELETLLGDLANDDAVSVIILTGAGEKSFVAGADIKELATLNARTAKDVASRGQRIFRMVETSHKPVIAAINGFALGGGCELALAAHIRVASNNARLGLPEVGLGLIPGYGGTQRLARIVGKGLALELILTGNMVKAERAREMGLINHVTEPEALLEKCHDLAKAMLSKAPLALSYALEAVNNGLEMGQEDGERLEASLFGLLASTDDCKEGLSAFIEKREAQFKGN